MPHARIRQENKRRCAPNLQNVISADALGDVTDGNVGDFLKFLPVITAEYTRTRQLDGIRCGARLPTRMADVSGNGIQ